MGVSAGGGPRSRRLHGAGGSSQAQPQRCWRGPSPPLPLASASGQGLGEDHSAVQGTEEPRGQRALEVLQGCPAPSRRRWRGRLEAEEGNGHLTRSTVDALAL